MRCCGKALELTTAVNSLAVLLSECLDDDALELAAVVLTQLGDTLGTIAVQRSILKNCTGKA